MSQAEDVRLISELREDVAIGTPLATADARALVAYFDDFCDEAVTLNKQLLEQRHIDRAAARALVEALPRCQRHLDRPATQLQEYTGDELCDECSARREHMIERGYLPALRALIKRMEDW